MGSSDRQLKVLIVDDEERIQRALTAILSARKYKTLAASTGEDALDLAIDWGPDLIVLDLSLPGISGLDVCRELRNWYAGPILFLSVHDSDVDKITALDMGADDYLTKPFSAGELLARIRALIRRSPSEVIEVSVITIDELEVDVAHHKVRRSGMEIPLTPIEFEILAFLARNAGRVITSKMLLEQVWGAEYAEETQTLRVHISNLRKKVEPHSSVPQYIITEPGVGFYLKTP
ncbi:MAG: response regulator transcription factor [Candidatus Aquicultorales bacterium]